MTDILAIDFGTSNSAAAVLRDGQVHRIPIEENSDTLPTAVFFPAGKGQMRIGSAAADALIGGEDGRYMRALKSILGTPLLHESRLIGGRRRSVAEIISDFLAELRQRAEAQTGERFRRALSGRPVRFHSRDDERNIRAAEDLRACYHAAGFDDVDFLAEPEAAALASQRAAVDGQLGLVVDIGGGTSDFSVFRSSHAQPEVIASYGIRLGGTDFDHAVSMTHAMPALGLGGQLRREMGDDLLPVPRVPYVDLASWPRIPFVYTPETRRNVDRMARLALDRPAMLRLAAVLEHELGHELAFAVERGKIDANGGSLDARVAMGFIEPNLYRSVTPSSLDAAMATFRDELREAIAETLTLAGVSPAEVAQVVLVGGSSLMGFVAEEAATFCPAAALERSDAFTAVVDGLALATRDR